MNSLSLQLHRAVLNLQIVHLPHKKLSPWLFSVLDKLLRANRGSLKHNNSLQTDGRKKKKKDGCRNTKQTFGCFFLFYPPNKREARSPEPRPTEPTPLIRVSFGLKPTTRSCRAGEASPLFGYHLRLQLIPEHPPTGEP